MSAKAKLVDVIHQRNGAWTGRCSCGNWAGLGSATKQKLTELWERHARQIHGLK